MKWTSGKIALAVVISVMILLLLILWGSYNGLVAADEAVDTAWAQVESQYQRRVDLIPNLVSTVQGFAQQEREILTEVTRLRSQWAAAGSRDQQIAAAQGLDGALGRLLLVSESYPQLKSNENFLALQAELAGTENRIAVERKRYNDAVRVLNVKVRKFPTVIVAGMFGFEQEKYFEAQEGSDVVPVVDFGGDGGSS